MTAFADIVVDGQPVAIGVQKQRDGNNTIRVAGETIYSAAVLAKQLPLQIINADSFQLIEGSPAQRRQFLDWMVFHVKPEFPYSLLRRDKIAYSDLSPWDIELCRLSKHIDELREGVFREFIETFADVQKEFAVSTELQFEMQYYCGWNREQTFEDVLLGDFDRDRRDGYTHHGPQRADIKLLANTKPAVDVLSRGQEKALISAMHIAQASMYQQKTGQRCVFLIDDLLAELDQSHCQQLTAWLSALNGQVFITGISQEGLMNAWKDKPKETKTFHVKQGSVDDIL